MEWSDRINNQSIISTKMIGRFRLTVHTYHGCGDTLFASCYGLFESRQLAPKDLGQAKHQAQALLQSILEEATGQLYAEFKEERKEMIK